MNRAPRSEADPDPGSGNPRSADRRRAGAYGFSRFEIRALLLLLVIAGSLGLYRWWDRQAASATLPWVVEDVVVESPRPPASETTDSAGNRAPSSQTSLGVAVDLNAAPASVLSRLPGIGPVLAQRIVDERERGGPFRDLSDLRRVPGIGAGKARALAGWVTFSLDTPPDTAETP